MALRSVFRTPSFRTTSLTPFATPTLSHTAIARSAGPCSLSVDQPSRDANLSAIRAKMKSVGSIKKITAAMKMVAAAKLRAVQTLQENARPFADTVSKFFKLMDKAEQDEAAAKLARSKSEEDGKGAEGSELYLPLFSDRGLCGGVNTQIVKASKLVYNNAADKSAIKFALIGDKGRDALARQMASSFTISFKDVFKAPVSFAQISIITEDILALKPANITVIYNRFKSAIAQEVTLAKVHGLASMIANASVFDEYEFESDQDSQQVFVDLYEFQLAVQLYGSCLENGTSEQAARMSAMDNASKNAGEMLAKLTLNYNRQRQAVITSELIEIISGAEALKG